MKKWIALVLVALLMGACKADKRDLRHPLINTNSFSSFIPLENLDDKIEGIMSSETNKPTNVFCPRNY